jgi:hypothetical protein
MRLPSLVQMRCNLGGLLPLALTAALAACSAETSEEDAPEQNVGLRNVPISQSEVSPPNYDEKEGDTYLYVAAVSEEDRKAGRSAGNVVMFRYLGEANGTFRIASVGESGKQFGVSTCPRQCKVIKTTWSDGSVRRLGYDPASVIGSAFEDAFNGHLQAAKGGAEPPSLSAKSPQANAGGDGATVIPRAFVGEWNTDPGACGTGLSDTRLRIESGRLRFYESDGDVRDVTVHNSRSVTVNASFSGEGQTWNDTVQMTLSRSGNELTIDGFTRTRCPS